jgi:predicted AAA+ superfamily ATPase
VVSWQHFRDLLYRDVVSRHEIRDIQALEQVALCYLTNTANLITYNRIKNTYGLAMDQVRAYTSYLEEAYLIRQLPRYSPKISARARSPRKVYAVDVGMRNAVAFSFSQDLGRIAETVVHSHLIRDPNTRIFYYQGRRECDFLIWRGEQAVQAIQVCYDPQDMLPEREIAGLEEVLKATGLKEGLIITHGIDDVVSTQSGLTVHMRPLWRWLCEAEDQQTPQ